MEIVNVLFIDDNVITDDVDLLRKRLRNVGYDMISSFIDIGSADIHSTNPRSGEKYIDKRKLKDLIEKDHMDKYYDLVACDFNFSDDGYDGYKLLTWLINTSKQQRRLIRKADFVFYSGRPEEVFELASNDVKGILKLQIKKIIDRPNLVADLNKIIVQRFDSIDFASEYLKILDRYHDMEFKSQYTPFKGKSLAEIYDHIVSGSAQGIEFQKVLIEQTISHMIKLQDD